MAINLDGNGLLTTGLINSATAQNSTSGTSIDFTGIPAGVKRITVLFNNVSTNGTANTVMYIGAGSIDSTATYVSNETFGNSTVASGTSSTQSNWTICPVLSASQAFSGKITIHLFSTNLWIMDGLLCTSGSAGYTMLSGTKTLSGTLDRLRINTGGSDAFDAGSINILYE